MNWVVVNRCRQMVTGVKHDKTTIVALGLLLISFIACAFCFGVFYGQQTFTPQVITETVAQYEEVPHIINSYVPVYKEVEVEIVKEVPLTLREFESLDELQLFLEEDDTESKCILYSIRGTGGQISLNGTCDFYALQLQRRGLEKGFLVSTEIIKQGNRDHMINSTVIGNEIYFIEPQEDKVWLWGYRVKS